MSVQMNLESGRTVASVSGDIDANSCNAIGEELNAIEVTGDALVLDMSEVSFLDSSGVSELLRLRQNLAEANTSLIIVEPSSAVHRVLGITGLLEVFGLAS